jgi:hypothetical protein
MRITVRGTLLLIALLPQVGSARNDYLYQATEYFNQAVDSVKRRIFILETLGKIFVPMT